MNKRIKKKLKKRFGYKLYINYQDLKLAIKEGLESGIFKKVQIEIKNE